MSTGPSPIHIDIVTLSVAVTTAIFSPELAALIGPYVVILFGATLGAAWGASRKSQSSRWSAAGYIAGVIGIALIVTVPASELMARHWGIEARWTLGPVAAVIGGIGRDWPAVGRWAAGLVRVILERFARGDRPGGS